jgi:DNA primase
MSKRIPQSFIDEIISRADIVEVVGRRVQLKRAGALYKGLCPFHDEKTPSFIVTPARGTYHCFGCAAHGTAVGFLMNYDSMSFPEAIETLADMLGLPMPERSADDVPSENDVLFELLQEADRWFRAELRQSERAIAYLKRRGIDGPTAAQFGIGYAPDAWDGLLLRLGTNDRRRGELTRAGLLRRNESGRYYDYFRDRIMFPIRDARGRTLGFGGRLLGEGEPKYLNSPETPVFEKRKTLYGLHEARQTGGAMRDVLVVEGYMDVVGLAQHGIGPALATLGTATTPEHVQRLTRFADRIVFCFDGDAAGRKAAWRALEACLPFGGGQIEIAFMLLPGGEDPDSFVRRHGASAFIEHKMNAQPLSRFFVQELSGQNDLGSADGRARLLAQARPLLARLPNEVYRELLIAELASAVDMPAARIAAAVQPETVREPLPAARPKPAATGPGRRSKLIRTALALVVKYPNIADKIDDIDDFSTIGLPGAELLLRLIAAARERPGATTAHLLERFRDDSEGQYLPLLATEDLLDDEASAPAVLQDCMAKLVSTERRRQAADAVKRGGAAADKPV